MTLCSLNNSLLIIKYLVDLKSREEIKSILSQTNREGYNALGLVVVNCNFDACQYLIKEWDMKELKYPRVNNNIFSSTWLFTYCTFTDIVEQQASIYTIWLPHARSHFLDESHFRSPTGNDSLLKMVKIYEYVECLWT